MLSLVTLEERFDFVWAATNAGAHKIGSELPANHPRNPSHCANRLFLFTIYRRILNGENGDRQLFKNLKSSQSPQP
jgi:hypothetical protein